MAAESSAAPRERRRLRAVLQVIGLAAALLVISEAVWMWQTWPVRELLQPTSSLQPGATR